MKPGGYLGFSSFGGTKELQQVSGGQWDGGFQFFFFLMEVFMFMTFGMS